MTMHGESGRAVTNANRGDHRRPARSALTAPQLGNALEGVRFRGHTGKHLLVLSLTGFDPDVWSGRASQEVSSIWRMRSCINVSGL
jgi:hypothetical protein